MAKTNSPETPIEPVLLSVRQAAEKLSLSTFTVYKLLDDGRLEGKYQGVRRYVVNASIPAYVNGLSTTPPAESA